MKWLRNSVFILSIGLMAPAGLTTSCITAKDAPKSYGRATKTSKEQRKAIKRSKKNSVKRKKNAGSYNPKTDF